MTQNPRTGNPKRLNVWRLKVEAVERQGVCLCFLGIQLSFEMGILVQVIVEGGSQEKEKGSRKRKGREEI